MTAALLALALAQLPDGGTLTRQLLKQTRADEFTQQLLDDGTHLRFGTERQGPVHVYRPRHYQPKTATTVVYLHGFYTQVDAAMGEHQLARQFRDSGLNALFVVPATRSWATDGLPWEDLEALLATVETRAKVTRPSGAITVVGHSGAYKNVVPWLQHPAVRRVVLLDGLYGNDDDFTGWVEAPSDSPRQLVLIGFETQQRAGWLTKKHAVATFDAVPFQYDELPANARKARIVSFQSERFDHMEQVTSGRLLPWVLRAFR